MNKISKKIPLPCVAFVREREIIKKMYNTMLDGNRGHERK